WVSAALVSAVLVLPAAVARAGDEPKDLDKIPKVVMDALKAKFPRAKIDKWTKETEGGKVIYDMEFKQDGRRAEADIAEDGTIQNFEKEFDAKDLPKAVTEAVAKKYPGSKQKEVMEITEVKDKKEVHGGFEIVLETADKKEVEVTVAQDGKILEDSGAKKEEEDYGPPNHPRQPTRPEVDPVSWPFPISTEGRATIPDQRGHRLQDSFPQVTQARSPSRSEDACGTFLTGPRPPCPRPRRNAAGS